MFGNQFDSCRSLSAVLGNRLTPEPLLLAPRTSPCAELGVPIAAFHTGPAVSRRLAISEGERNDKGNDGHGATEAMCRLGNGNRRNAVPDGRYSVCTIREGYHRRHSD